MKVVDFLKREWIIADLVSQDKEAVLRELVSVLEKNNVISSADSAVKVLLERERLGSTGIGEGIAIPHGKLAELPDVVSVFGVSRQGVNFDSMDGAPVHLFFLLMAPEGSASTHLKVLARISRLLRAKQFRNELLDLQSQDELFEKIASEDNKYT